MKRQIRKQLKTDPLAQEMSQGIDFLTHHRTEAIRYGSIALAVIILGTGYYLYSNHQASVRADALAAAMKIDQAIIGPKGDGTNIAFPTQAEKATARTQAFTELATKYSGTAEGAIGGIFIGAEHADTGDLTGAEKIYKNVVDSAPKEYAALAKVSLAHIYAAEGKPQEGEKLLQSLIDHPTTLVSSDSAKLELAEVVATYDPDKALKMVEPLRNSRTAVSKAAIDEVGRIKGITP